VSEEVIRVTDLAALNALRLRVFEAGLSDEEQVAAAEAFFAAVFEAAAEGGA
jgi:hypothetical protein